MDKKSKTIWFDCDVGIDDAVAMIFQLFSPELKILGFSSVSGNVNVDKTTINCLKILEMCKKTEYDVIKGCDKPFARKAFHAEIVHGESGLGKLELPFPQKKAIEKNPIFEIYQRISKSPVKVTLVAVGPLTNIALLLKIFPDVKNNLEEIVIMGGAVGQGNVTPSAEFNIYCDPESAESVFQCGFDKIILFPLDITTTTFFTLEFQETLLKSDSQFLKNIGIMSKSCRDNLIKAGFNPNPHCHDSCTIFYLLREDLITLTKMKVNVEMGHSLSFGRTLCDEKAPENEKNVYIAVELNAKKFDETLHNSFYEGSKFVEKK